MSRCHAASWLRSIQAISVFRPTEVDILVGDPSKARSKLGWRHRVSFEQLVAEMVAADLKAVAGETSRVCRKLMRGAEVSASEFDNGGNTRVCVRSAQKTSTGDYRMCCSITRSIRCETVSIECCCAMDLRLTLCALYVGSARA